MTGFMSSSNTENNTPHKKTKRVVDEMIENLSTDMVTVNVSLKRFKEDIVELHIVDEYGTAYTNINVADLLSMYDPLMKTMKIIVKSEK
jgi:hypothetical protein